MTLRNILGRPAFLATAMAIPLISGIALGAESREFREVDPSLLLLKTPKLDPRAEAEAVFWEVRMTEGSTLRSEHYLRLKIFTENGRNQHSSIEIPSNSNEKISRIMGRTVKPDGTIVVLDPASVFERDIVKAGRRKIKTHSFAMPGVVPGAVIEYRWSEESDRESLHHATLELQRDVPVWKVSYSLRPMKAEGLTLEYKPFQAPDVRFKWLSKDNYSLEVENILPYRAEPNAPPERNLRPWILLMYETRFTNYQLSLRKVRAEAEFREWIKPKDEVRRLAVELTAAAATNREKLVRLAEYCRTRIRNVRYEDGPAAAILRKEAGKIKDPAGVLKAKAATGTQINLLFASLAQAIGLDAHHASMPDRSIFLGPGSEHEYFVSSGNIAIMIDNRWYFFDPATRDVQPGMLRWQEEGVNADIVLPGKSVRLRTPWSPPAASKADRKALIRLTPEGNAEAEITLIFSGHFNVGLKEYYSGLTAAEVSEEIKDAEVARLPGARVDKINVENLTDPAQPLTISFRVSLPGYAQRAGSRLLVPAGFFQRGAKPRFTGSERKNPVYFHFPWAEEDYVQLQIPDGFQVESLDQPDGINITDVGAYDSTVTQSVVGGQKYLIYTRKFDFGRNGIIIYPAQTYPTIKTIFDRIQRLDEYVVSLRGGRPGPP